MAISAIFGRPFAEQQAAWRLRLGELRPTQHWADVSPQFHDRGFMVAGAVKAELLGDLAGAVDKAIVGGGTLESFRRDFREIVARHGWTGWTGEGSERGEAWRTRTIWRTNMATTYAAGRRAQLTEGGFALWVYRHGGSRRPRPQHLAWDGLTLPADHPFWDTHYPPNGWGCSCRVMGARDDAGARRVGGNPDLVPPEGWDRPDAATGVPPGIHKGWDHAPGASVVETVLSLVPRLDVLPPQPSVALIQNWLTMDAFADWMSAPEGAWPMARLPDADAGALGLAQSRVALLSAETAAKQLREHPELLGLDYLQVQNVIDHATERIRDTPRSMVYIQSVPGANGHVLVVKATQDGERLYIQSFRRLSLDEATRDRELRRLRRRQS